MKKPTISIDAALYELVTVAADKAGMTFSAWLSAAARTQLQQDSLQAAIAHYEAEHGEFTDDELAATAVAQALREAEASTSRSQTKPRRRAS